MNKEKIWKLAGEICIVVLGLIILCFIDILLPLVKWAWNKMGSIVRGNK